MGESFVDVLEEFLRVTHFNRPQLADAADISRETVESWFKRDSTPRHTEDIIRIARALRLSEYAANRLCKAAKRSDLHLLHEEAQRKRDNKLLELLTFWTEGEAAALSASGVAVVPFQAPRLDTVFVGRQEEFTQVKQALLADSRICVILGMGGIGKSSLAAYIAGRLRWQFADGVLWARIPDPRPGEELAIEDRLMPILGTFAEAYGRDVSQYADLDSRARIVREVLTNKRALIVIDNLQSSQELDFLVPGTPMCSTLITTRYPKSVQGYYKEVVRVHPFKDEDGLALLGNFVGPKRIVEEKAGAQAIIDFVGGLPLALRIIGSTLAESPYLTIAEYADMLATAEGQLAHLEDWQDATKSVRASFELSYRRLDPPSQRLFTTLALFDGDHFSIAAVAAAVQTNPVQVKLQMGRLVSVSLLDAFAADERTQISPTEVSKTELGMLERYRLHSLLKLFAREKFSGVLAPIQQSIVTYYMNLAHTYRQKSYRLLDLDWANMDGVFRWLWGQNAWPLVVELVNDLTFINLGTVGFLEARGYWAKALNWLEDLLGQPVVKDDLELVSMLRLKAGAFAFRLAQFTEAERHLQQAYEVARQLADNDTTLLIKAYICEWMSQLLSQRDFDQALVWSEQGVDLIRHTQADALLPEKGYLLIRHATNLARRGDLAEARPQIEKALTRLPPLPTAARISAYITLGRICSLQGEPDHARAYWQQGEADARMIGDDLRLARIRLNLAAEADEQGRFAESLQYNQQALQLYQRLGDVEGEGLVSSNLAFTYLVQQSDTASALPHLQNAEQLAEQHDLQDVKLFSLVNRAHWHLHFQEYDQASVLLQAALELSQKLEEASSYAEILRLQSRVAQHNQDFGRAMALIEESLRVAAENDLEAGISWRCQGDIAVALGNKLQAEATYQHSLRLLKNYPLEQARTQLALAKYYLDYQAAAKARTLLAPARDTFERLQAVYELKQADKLATQLISPR